MVTSWEFRALFRWFVRYVGPSRKGQSPPGAFSIQLRPDVGPEADEKNSRMAEYLSKLFGRHDFSVFWGEPDAFVRELWTHWTAP